MKRRKFSLDPIARRDLKEIWLLIADRDGAERAESMMARIRAFCLSLQEFASIGTRHDDCRPGLLSVGVPGLKSATILFYVTSEAVVVIGVGYLGRNVWARVGGGAPIHEMEEDRKVRRAIVAADTDTKMIPHEQVAAESEERIARRTPASSNSDETPSDA